MNLNALLQALQNKTGQNPKRNGNTYSTKCPSHDDQNPSLSIGEGADGKLLIKCHAGCPIDEICASIGITPSDLFQTELKYPTRVYTHSQPIIEYVYHNAQNNPLYKKTRLPPKDTAKKQFQIQTWKDGTWVWGLKTTTRVLYSLPKVMTAIGEGKEVYLVEGEKDADRLAKEGLIATTPIEGAGSLLSKDYVEQLKNGNIVLLYDEDRAGHKRRDQWIELLSGHVANLKVVALPGLIYQDNHGHDVSDWLSQNHTIEELLSLAKETQSTTISLKQEKRELVVVTLPDFLARDIQPRELVLSPIIPTQGLTMLYAKRGVGKTFVALGVGIAVATGGSMLKWSATKPRKVLYVDGEMPAAVMQERLSLLAIGMNLELPDPSFFRLITPDLQPEGIPDLATSQGQTLINNTLKNTDLLILDNLSTLVRSTQENESDAWLPIQEWALQLRRNGVSILIVHHAGKSGQQRGTSRREDVLDTVIVLKQPIGYSPKEGAKFNVEYEKSRGFFGIDAEPFSVEIISSNEDGLQWKIADVIDIKDDLTNQILDLHNKSVSYREIAKTLGTTKNIVEGTIKRLKGQETHNE